MEPALRMAVWRPHVSEETRTPQAGAQRPTGGQPTTPMLAIKPGARPLPQAGVAPLVPPTAAPPPHWWWQ